MSEEEKYSSSDESEEVVITITGGDDDDDEDSSMDDNVVTEVHQVLLEQPKIEGDVVHEILTNQTENEEKEELQDEENQKTNEEEDEPPMDILRNTIIFLDEQCEELSKEELKKNVTKLKIIVTENMESSVSSSLSPLDQQKKPRTRQQPHDNDKSSSSTEKCENEELIESTRKVFNLLLWSSCLIFTLFFCGCKVVHYVTFEEKGAFYYFIVVLDFIFIGFLINFVFCSIIQEVLWKYVIEFLIFVTVKKWRGKRGKIWNRAFAVIRELLCDVIGFFQNDTKKECTSDIEEKEDKKDMKIID